MPATSTRPRTHLLAALCFVLFAVACVPVWWRLMSSPAEPLPLEQLEGMKRVASVCMCVRVCVSRRKSVMRC